jgi:SAM-dependent methyltransferase
LSSTIAYYDRNADRFFKETAKLDMSALYVPFLARICRGGRILDAGCGSGRDSLYFLQRGYEVEAFDASIEMCKIASQRIGQVVLHKNLEEVDDVSAFDGIWACASPLHIPRSCIDGVLQRFGRALKTQWDHVRLVQAPQWRVEAEWPILQRLRRRFVPKVAEEPVFFEPLFQLDFG